MTLILFLTTVVLASLPSSRYISCGNYRTSFISSVSSFSKKKNNLIIQLKEPKWNDLLYEANTYLHNSDSHFLINTAAKLRVASSDMLGKPVHLSEKQKSGYS